MPDLAPITSTLDAVPTGMILTDLEGIILSINPPIESIFGYTRQEICGQPIEILVPDRLRPNHVGHRQGFCAAPVTRIMGAGRDLYGRHKDGRDIPIEIGLNPIQADLNRYIISSVIDLSERHRDKAALEQLNEDLRQSLQEREVLLREVHHRVKNNLQVLSSLLNMQLRSLPRENSSRLALEEFQSRVQSIALIHEQLYQSGNQAQVPLLNYLQSLLQNIFSACGVESSIHLEAHGSEATSLPLDRAIPAGLILNELITNAVQHAFEPGQKGRVWVDLEEDDNQVRMQVNDSGRGFPENLEGKSGSLGLQIVNILTRQLGGKLHIERLQPGTAFLIEFPKEGAN